MKSLQGFIRDTSPLITKALGAMQNKASEIGVNVGVSEISVWHTDINNYKLTLSLTNNSLARIGVKDESDVNYAGVASAKNAQMKRTMKFSGRDEGLIGEVPYRGGLCFKKDGYSVLVSYSGGTQEEDVEIATTGIGVMGAIE